MISASIAMDCIKLFKVMSFIYNSDFLFVILCGILFLHLWCHRGSLPGKTPKSHVWNKLRMSFHFFPLCHSLSRQGDIVWGQGEWQKVHSGPWTLERHYFRCQKCLWGFFILRLHEVKDFHLNFISQWLNSILIATVGHVLPGISLIPRHLTFPPEGSMTYMSYLRISWINIHHNHFKRGNAKSLTQRVIWVSLNLRIFFPLHGSVDNWEPGIHFLLALFCHRGNMHCLTSMISYAKWE